MRVATAIVMLGCVFPIQSCAECLPFSEAPKNIGASKCTTGKVLKVTCGVSGTYFLNFCPDYRGCPLSGRGQKLRKDRKSTRLNSSHTVTSYAVFCLKKKTTIEFSGRGSR